MWFLPPYRIATFPEFHNLKGIPQEKSYMVEFGTALLFELANGKT